MRDGPCPECGSRDVYLGVSSDGQGLRDEHAVQVRVGSAFLDVQTYVCADCGHVRLFLAGSGPQFLPALAAKNTHWRPAAGAVPK
jgi:DNA-directed RNA polymerase subunit RPC12/RpoP